MAGDEPTLRSTRGPQRIERARLAGSIDDLGRIYSRRNRGSRKLGRFERHLVQHRSMPKVQKADLVCIQTHDKDRPKRHSVEIGAVDRDRWPFKPRTDFERTYFDDLDSYEGRSKTFQASRERLHEIFEHNRYLRRKFFADMPGSSAPDLKFTGTNTGTGFGSTETVTSQSNHSGESSNGRKSRTDFNSDTPDSVQLKESRSSFEGLKIGEPKDQIETEGLRLLNRLESKIEEFKYPKFNSESIAWDDDSKSVITDVCSERSSLSESLFGKSLPNLSKLGEEKKSVAKIAVNGKVRDLSESLKVADLCRFRGWPTDSSESSDAEWKIARTSERYESEDRELPTKSCEVSPRDHDASEATVVDSDSDELVVRRSRESFLRSSQSLLELSKSPPATKIRRFKDIRRNRSALLRGFNKSCSDLSVQDELRSPKLVNEFKHSLGDLRRCASLASTYDRASTSRLESRSSSGTNSPLMDHRKSRTGTTLPFVYGPIPFSQYKFTLRCNLHVCKVRCVFYALHFVLKDLQLGADL